METSEKKRSKDRRLLTIVVPIRNEERNLRQCLEAIGDFADVLVVDSQSEDRSVAIAEEFGARVVQFFWNGGFPKKKNWVLQQGLVTTEWVLFLDADEILTESFKYEIRQTLPNTRKNGFWLTYENYFLGQRLRWGIPFRKLFLMRNGKGAFQRVEDDGWTSLDMEVHEQLEIDGEVGVIRSPILHQDKRGFEHFLKKHNEYSTWEAKRFLAGRETFRPSLRQRVKRALLDSYLLAPLYFFINYVVRLGFLDGRSGFVYSVLKAVYFFEVKVKIDELRARGDAPIG